MTNHQQGKLTLSTGLSTRVGILVFLCVCGLSGSALAKEAPEPVNKDALRNLAREFVAKLGGKLKAHDAAVNAEKTAENPLSLIPDGEMLLLSPRAEKFIMDREVATIKNNGRVYYGLQELIGTLELAIDYSDEKKTGSGWFLREDWLIRMDFVSGEVVSRGKSFKVSPDDIYEDGGLIYISQKAAQEWLEIKTEPDIAQQYLNINTPFPFPALARNYRERESTGNSRAADPILPRLNKEHEWLDINVAEIQQNMRVTKKPETETTVNHQNITTIQGDALKHNLYATSLWDNNENLSSIRARLTKEDENPVLLGPLKARSYTIGDTDLTQVPLTGNTAQELGIRINNNPLRNADFQDTTIAGDAMPGWDVELYRDGLLVDRLRVDETARYEFQDIQLFAGENLFEVFFYGPQGEIRSDNFNIPVTTEFLSTQNDTYDVSLSFSDSQLYTKLPSEDEDADTPHLVAKYNKVIGNTLTYAGIRARQENGEAKAYLGTGFTNVIGGFVLDGNAAADEKGATALQLGTRKNIDNWRLSLQGNLRDEDFQGTEDQNVMSVNAAATKSFVTPFNTFATINANTLYGVRSDDSTQTTSQLGLSNQIGRLNISNTTTYDKIDNLPGDEIDASINNFLSARMNFGRVYTRAGIDFNVKPESKIDSYFAQVSYQPNKTIGGDVLVEHDPDSDLTQGRLTVNYRNDKFRLSPFVDVDSNSEVQAGVKLTTALVDEPGKTLPTFTSDRLLGRGLVSSFVYHDKNGNNMFDGNDEPLPDVYVESVNITRRAPTNDKGYSLIKDLPENFVTDIRVDKSTLPDPFMIPGFDGVSIYPRPGQMVNLTFPVHLAGEIDGSIYVENDGVQTEVPGMGLNLIPVDGKSSKILDTFAAGDGYYVLSNVPPGQYLLGISSTAAERMRAGGAKPVPVTIGYDGTVLSAQNFILEKGRVQVPVSIKPYKGPDHDRPFFAMETGDAPTKSKLSRLLSRLMEKKTNIRADEGLSPITVEGEENLKVLPGQDWSAHYDRCQVLNDQKIPCKLILFVPEKKKGTKPTVVAQN